MTRWLGVLLVLLLTGCSGGGDSALPDGPTLLRKASDGIRQVDTLKFGLKADGKIEGIAISSADGQLTRGGDVKGTAVITSTGQPAEAEFVIVGDTLYLKGPTGGFQKLPSSVAASVYDPTKILDDNLGLAALVAGASQPAVQGKESVDGVDCYHVKVTFAKNNLGILLPGSGAKADLPGELWVTTSDPSRPVRAKVAVPANGQFTGGTVTITLSDFNGSVDIVPPA